MSFLYVVFHHHLEFILVVDLLARPEFLGQVEGLGHMLWRHEVIDDLNTAVEILDLKVRTEGKMNSEYKVSDI